MNNTDTGNDPNVAAFKAQLPDLLKLHEGKFALFVDAKLVGVFDTMAAAYEVAVERHGTKRAYISRVSATKQEFHAPALTVGLIRPQRC